MIKSFAELDARFAAIAGKTHTVRRNHAGAAGELFEVLMQGEIVGNDKGADFAAINCEAKVHTSKSATTIFCMAFSRGIKPAEFSKRFGSGTVRMGKINKAGQSVAVVGDALMVTVNGQAVAGWSLTEIAKRIEEKMPNLAMVNATKHNNRVVFNQMFIGKRVVADHFIASILAGDVVIEMRSGAVQFRAQSKIIETWFETTH